ncbi:MAG TPA: hypothetical protein EYP04_09030 [Anaerolineae bacterium]|nr:hypothetical protein [Anaerolineae bacterium]
MDLWTSWLHTQLNWRTEPGLWVLSSVLVYILATWLTWLLMPWLQSHRPARLPQIQTAGLRWGLQLAYLAGPAYLTLLLGIVSLRHMGLGELDWVRSLGVGGTIALISLTLLLLVAWAYRRALAAHPAPPVAHQVPQPPLGVLGLLIQAAAEQLHWALYRATAIRWLLNLPANVSLLDIKPAADPTYWGSWIGLGLVCAEWLLTPTFYTDLRWSGQAEDRYRRLALLLLTTVLFYFSRNLYLCWGAHAMADIIVRRWCAPSVPSASV